MATDVKKEENIIKCYLKFFFGSPFLANKRKENLIELVLATNKNYISMEDFL